MMEGVEGKAEEERKILRRSGKWRRKRKRGG